MTKSLLKTQLWHKLEQLIRSKRELQTSEMMPESGKAKSQKEKDFGNLETHDLTLEIRLQMPGATPHEVHAERFVAMELVPGFRDGVFEAAGVDGYPSMTWPPETEDSVFVSVCQ